MNFQRNSLFKVSFHNSTLTHDGMTMAYSCSKDYDLIYAPKDGFVAFYTKIS